MSSFCSLLQRKSLDIRWWQWFVCIEWCLDTGRKRQSWFRRSEANSLIQFAHLLVIYLTSTFFRTVFLKAKRYTGSMNTTKSFGWSSLQFLISKERTLAIVLNFISLSKTIRLSTIHMSSFLCHRNTSILTVKRKVKLDICRWSTRFNQVVGYKTCEARVW